MQRFGLAGPSKDQAISAARRRAKTLQKRPWVARRLGAMASTAAPDASFADPTRLTITYSENADGWVTAQVVEYPAAISQGPTRHEAWLNVLDALHDLTHEPTPAERVAFTVQAWLAELADLLAQLGELGQGFIGTAADHGRAALERGHRSGLR